VSVDLSQFIGEFLQESYEGLDIMESCLLAFDNDPEQVDSIFRAAHSIKGGAGTFGFVEVAAFTHNAETLLDEIRKLTIEVDDEIINVLLESVDILRNMLRATEQNEPQNTPQIDGVSEQLERILALNGKDDSTLSSQKNNQENEQIEPVDPETLSTDIDHKGLVVEWMIGFKPKPKILQSGNEPMFIFEALAELGQVTIEVISDQLPSIEEFDAEQLYVSWLLTLETENIDQTNEYVLEQIHEVFEWVEDFSDIEISPSRYAQAAVESITEAESENETSVSDHHNNEQSKSVKDDGVALRVTSNTAQAEKESDLQKQKSTKQQGTEISSVRVEIERLDELLNRVGELVVTQAMLSQAGREVTKAGLQNQRLEQGLLQLESNTRDLQQDVMRMRMLPISFVFNRYLRLVHDISSKLGKKVSLQITGEQTEIDKTVMEKIGDPLTHLIRNALDHGMETSQERIELGKSAKGTIALNAYHHNGFIVIDVIDDGRGLNLAKIQQKAVQKKIITADQQLSDDELKNLIFKPGFSTVDQLSELSGRGVGMDVVLRNIESLGGQITVDSNIGEGTSFSVRVPLTLAIIEGQLIKINDENYVIPLVSIIETILVKSGDIKRLADHDEFINYRDEYIHLINLGSLFAKDKIASNVTMIDEHLSEQAEQDNIETVKLIIVVESIGKKVGFIVDQLAAQQQFVVKPLETNFRKVAGIVGGTILGDGSVALILDSAGLINQCERLSTQDQSSTNLSGHK
jgi:two-component system chemotaxis sensor kinase CheA